MRKQFHAKLTLTIAALILMTSNVLADDGHAADSNEVKYRHAVMEAMSNQFAALAMVFTNRVKRPQDLQVHAAALAKTATIAGELFPAGSEGGDALPIIWQEPDKFAAAAQKLVDASAALAAATEGGDRATIAKAFKTAGGACKGCHERYKEEEED
jgi:cytochrome c556